ncbi:MAG: winged helix-turn-helix transcriptional regulator [Solirubrobacteraceae bacterium]
MGDRRSYADPCGIARALDIVGERWTLLIVRELMLGPKRFVDLRAGLTNLSANVLAQRLRELESAGLVTRRTLPPPAASRVYELTPRGQDLEPVLLALGRWGRHAPFPADAAPLGIDAVILALPTTFNPSRAHGVETDLELRLGPNRFLARIHDSQLTVSRDSQTPADAGLHTDPATLATLLWHDGDLDTITPSKTARVAGDRAQVERFLTLFTPNAPQPPPAPTPS